MKVSAPNPRDRLAERLRTLMPANRSVREVPMFGGLSFMVDDVMAVAAGRLGDLLVRINPADYDELMCRGATPAVMGTDRSMGRGWVTVPAQQLQDHAELSLWIGIGIDSRTASN